MGHTSWPLDDSDCECGTTHARLDSMSCEHCGLFVDVANREELTGTLKRRLREEVDGDEDLTPELVRTFQMDAADLVNARTQELLEGLSTVPHFDGIFGIKMIIVGLVRPG